MSDKPLIELAAVSWIERQIADTESQIEFLEIELLRIDSPQYKSALQETIAQKTVKRLIRAEMHLHLLKHIADQLV